MYEDESAPVTLNDYYNQADIRKRTIYRVSGAPIFDLIPSFEKIAHNVIGGLLDRELLLTR